MTKYKLLDGRRMGARSLDGKEERKMNKMEKVVFVLGSIFCLVFLGSSAFSQGYSSEFPAGAVGPTYQPMGWSPYEASWLIGHHVRTTTNGALGQISSLVIDKTNGRVALVVLSDVPKIGGEVLPIPYGSITNIGGETFNFNPGSMEIGVAPGAYYLNEDPTVYALTYHPSWSKFYGLPSVMDVAWLTEIYRHYGQPPYWTEGGAKAPVAMELFETNKLMGATVQLPDGSTAGRINDFVIDPSGGHIAFLVLSDVSGRSSDLVAVPFGIVSARGGDVFVVDTTPEQLALARGFDETNDLNSTRWAGDVYRYFGQQPYWTEPMGMAPASSESEGMMEVNPDRNGY